LYRKSEIIKALIPENHVFLINNNKEINVDRDNYMIRITILFEFTFAQMRKQTLNNFWNQ
jgi:hypothetical protein